MDILLLQCLWTSGKFMMQKGEREGKEEKEGEREGKKEGSEGATNID